MATIAIILGLVALFIVVLTSVKHYASQKLITLEVMMAGGIWLLGLALCQAPSAAIMANSLLASQVVLGGACVLFLLAVITMLRRPVPKSEMRRWLGELASLLHGGMRIDSALLTISANCRSLRLAEATKQMAHRIVGGDTLSQAMRVDEAFAEVIPSIQRGEENGNLPQALSELSPPSEDETEVKQEQAAAVGPPRVRMAVVIIVTEAIKQEASQVAFIPMQQGGYVGLRVLFTDKSGRQKEFDSVPHTVRMPLVNSMKAWAGIPYWAKSPSPATIPLRCDAKDYWMTISIVRTDLGESVSVAFAPKP